MKYSLSASSAKSADAPSRIETTGAYKGIFTKAKAIVSKSGTHGVEFDFKADNGATATRLTLYTQKADGTQIFGMNQLNACMACMSLRSIEPVDATIEEYSWDSGSNEKVKVKLFKELMNNPIGVRLQAEEYMNSRDEIKQRMTLAGFFDAKTNLTATEILDRKTVPQELEKAVARMPEVKKLKENKQHEQNTGGGYTPDVSDDDIPF